MSTNSSLLENPEETEQYKELAEIVQNFKQPIIEIGGPTPHGYDFLASSNLQLPFKPIITNISETVTHNPFGENPTEFTVDEVADARDLPYEDQTVGTLITCSLPHSTADIFRQFDTEEARQEYLSQCKAAALSEYNEYTPNSDVKSNLHLLFIREAARALIIGGSLVMKGASSEDIQAAELHGLDVIYEDSSTNTSIFKKRQLDS